MQIFPLKTPILKLAFDFEKVLEKALANANLVLEDSDILIIASKIVALQQGRIKKQKLKTKKNFLKDLVKKEANWISPYNGWLTLKDGIFIANAGIDESNVPEGECILWPEKPYEFADKFCKKIKKKFGLRDFGIIICDSHCLPLRRGVTGVALGYAGFEGVPDLRGQKDLYGKILKHTTRNLADSLSSSALIVMGESNESTPLALIRNAPVKFLNKKINPNDVKIPLKEDLFFGVINLGEKKI